MPITAADIKLLASARMTDAEDAGGQMTGTPLQDGAENNVFPAISTVDRAAGALALRKVYAAVLNTGTDTLLDAHVVLDDIPDDASVSGLLMRSANNGQTVAGLTAALNAAGESAGFFGSAAVTAPVAPGASVVPVAAVRAPLIPKTQLAEAVAGGLEATGAQPTVTGWEPSGQTVALTVVASGARTDLAAVGFYGRIAPGSVTGTFTAPGGAGTASSTPDGVLTLTAPGFTAVLGWQESTLQPMFSGVVSLLSLTDLNITAEALVPTRLPMRTIQVAPVDGRVVYEIQMPPGSSIASESVVVRYYVSNLGIVTGQVNYTYNLTYQLDDGRQTADTSSSPLVGSINLARATGLLTIVLKEPLPSDGGMTVTYAEGGATVPLSASALVNGGAITGNSAQVTPGAGLELAGAVFDIAGGESGLSLLGGVIRNGMGTVRGSASAAGVITIPGNEGRSITNWRGTQFNPNYGVPSVAATLPANIRPETLEVSGTTSLGASFSATASATGVFATAHVAGTYDATTGKLDLTFASGTTLRSLAFAGTRSLPQSSFADLYGLSPAVFAEDGTVPILRPGNLVVLRHSASLAPAIYANDNTINCGRTNLADVRLRGADGAGIATGWSADLAAGTVTVADISGWAQPVVVQHGIEHVALALSVPNAGAVVMSRATTREFPAGALLCSALRLGDLQARAGEAFAQATWTGAWSDTRIGDAIVAQYQQAANPIVVANNGAVTERWALIFMTNTTFRLVGETLGQIATGDINSALVPVNPATGQPYFSLAATGWGGGWSAGNVLRFNTTGANAAVWAARVVLPSAPNDAPDSLTIAVRGDIDA